jgi:hypothetical protein
MTHKTRLVFGTFGGKGLKNVAKIIWRNRMGIWLRKGFIMGVPYWRRAKQGFCVFIEHACHEAKVEGHAF